MKSFGGPVLFLDRSDINTDEIIPAKYLTEIEKEALKPHILEDLNLDGFHPGSSLLSRARVIVTRKNFGCGSSREHAAWVLEVNDITLVIAENFARIFRQNMFNCGMMALEVPAKDIDALFRLSHDGDVTCTIDKENGILRCSTEKGSSYQVSFSLCGFDRALVEAGGWIEFADTRY